MDKAAHPHAVWWLAFFSFIESSFFPIPPHPLLGLMCLAEPKKALRYALVCTIASVLGGMLGYAIGYFVFEAVGTWLIGSIGMTEMLPVAQCMVDRDGAWVVFVAAFTPLPFKLATIVSGFLGMSFLPFLIASIAGRASIFMIVGVLFRIFGAPIKRFIDEYLGWVTLAFVGLVGAGFLALTQFGDGDEDGRDAADSCAVPSASAAA
ncbi:DedA family protein [Erythrobacter mangrovi]|uniref:DedA family protein n=2 Tax=Erythrobacter mangrovi TaxID=2739433 RepID=A0A7D4CP82_9SPHN|nr:DedA family protein [Erythrobacter mangrovi]